MDGNMPSPPTTARLRYDLNRGRGDHKVAVVDPAVAPLGTDDEAAGTPPSASIIQHAHRQEVRSAPVSWEKKDRDHAVIIYLTLIAMTVAAVSLAIWLF